MRCAYDSWGGRRLSMPCYIKLTGAKKPPRDHDAKCAGVRTRCHPEASQSRFIQWRAKVAAIGRRRPGYKIALLISIEGPVGPHERCLKCVLRVIAVSQHPHRETCAAIVIAVYQRRVSVDVASQHTLHIGGIVTHVLGYNPPPRRWRHMDRR